MLLGLFRDHSTNRRRHWRSSLTHRSRGLRPSLERLEERTLLSVSPLPLDPIEMTLLGETQFAAKSGPLGKLNSDLASTFGQYVAHSARAGDDGFQPNNSLVQVSDGFVQIKAAASGDTADLLADLEALGLQGGVTSGYRVSGRLPLDAADEMAELESLQFASAALRPWTNVGATTSQGDLAMNADYARATFGVDGAGVTVGVISNSFDTSGTGSYAADQASGDLPAGVNVLADFPGSTDEGRGMMQLIHDVAPGADLAFHTAYSEEIDFAAGILALAAAGADVIVDDIQYLEEPMFQDGVIAQAVDTVEAGGVSYFSAAGNSARKSYESAFVDSGETLLVDGQPRGSLHDFDPGGGVDFLQSIYIPWLSSIYIAFQWDQPFYSVSGGDGSANDLDIYILNEAGTGVLAQSITRNIGGDPVEILSFTGGELFGQYNLMIANYGGPDPGLMKYVIYDVGISASVLNEYDTASGPLYGHANAAGAEAVGAAFYGSTPAYGQTPPLLESFSSAGGTPILFDTAGNRLTTPEIREKPEIVAPDGTNTSFFPAGNDTDGDGFPNFYGTSAAAPHAAAVAALMLELSPGLPPAQVYSTLETTAIDMGAAGFDNDSGYGLIQADLALAAVPSDPRLSVSIADGSISENGGVTTGTVTRWNTDNSGSLIVTLSSGDTSEATVPAGVTILAGQSFASFAINAVDDLLYDGTQTVTITASAAGLIDGSRTLQVKDDEPQLLSQWADTVIDFSTEWYDPFNPGAWQAIQALGPPNTFEYGDIPTAWEASTPDGSGVEYLTLGYATSVYATGVTVWENFGNGYVTRVDVREEGGALHMVWTGADPSLPGSPVDFNVSWAPTAYLVDAVKITINSLHNSDPSGGGWEAVDAVGLDGWDQPPPPPSPTVTIAATDASAAENPLDGGTFTISRTDTAGDLTVFYTVDPSGTTDSSDYLEELSGSVIIADGQSSATIVITPVNDTDEEGDETLILSLDAGAGYVVGSPGSATVTIEDDDLVTTEAYATSETTVSGTITTGSYLDTSASDDVYEEITERHSGGKPANRRSFLEHQWTFNVGGGDPVTFYVEAVRTNSGEGDDFVFDYSTNGVDYNYMLTVTKEIDDDTYQTALLSPGTSGTVYVRVTDTDPTEGNNVLDTIFIDEMFIRSSSGGTALPLVTITATDAAAAEAGQDPGEFTVSRTGDTAGALTVFYSLDPSSTADSSDYSTLSGSVIIPDGLASTTITVTPIDDGVLEPAETVILQLDSDPAYTIGSPAADTVTIADSGSALPLVTITATDAAAAEEGLDPGVFTVTRTGDTTDPLTVMYSIDAGSTATAVLDYQSLSGLVTIAGSASSATITVTPIDDEDIEGNETLTLNLTTDSAYIIGSPAADTVTIADNDSGPTTDDYAVSEVTVRGTLSSGSYLDTYAGGGGYEVIQERESGGRPANRYSLLEHKWTFNVTGGATVTFFVEAFSPYSVDGDDFVFAYSTDDSSYTDMVTVFGDSPTTMIQQMFILPDTLNGSVYVRVSDTDDTPGSRTLDTVNIDHMFFRSTAAAALSRSAAAVDLALLAWVDLDSSDGEDTDTLAIQAADELALMMIQ